MIFLWLLSVYKLSTTAWVGAKCWHSQSAEGSLWEHGMGEQEQPHVPGTPRQGSPGVSCCSGQSRSGSPPSDISRNPQSTSQTAGALQQSSKGTGSPGWFSFIYTVNVLLHANWTVPAGAFGNAQGTPTCREFDFPSQSQVTSLMFMVTKMPVLMV